jgi:hypothetical protein
MQLIIRPIQTRFPCGSDPLDLNLAAYNNSPVRSTKSTRSHLAHAPSACKHRVSGSLSLPARGTFHLSLTVLCAIGHQVVFSLGGWSPLLPAGFHVSRGTLDPGRPFAHFVYRTFTPSGAAFQRASTMRGGLSAGPQPHRTVVLWFGLFPFRSPLLRKSLLLSFPPATKMFQFAGFPPYDLCIQSSVTGHYSRRVSPFGYPRINACLRLPVAFRSSLRPSSALGAKASSLCS